MLVTIQYCAIKLPEESLVRTWKNAYMAQLRQLGQDGKDDPNVEALPSKRRAAAVHSDDKEIASEDGKKGLSTIILLLLTVFHLGKNNIIMQ